MEIKGYVTMEQQEEFEAWEKEQLAKQKGFKILSSRVFTDKNGKEYKQVHLQDEKGVQHTALAFPWLNFIYDEGLVAGEYNDDIGIKVEKGYFTIVSWSTVRNYKNYKDAIFILPNGDERKS